MTGRTSVFLHSTVIEDELMWEERDNQLYRKYIFANFNEAFGFMTQVALLSEQQNHHPTWTNTWNRVEIWLSTHDAGNTVTEKDRRLANAIDKIAVN